MRLFFANSIFFLFTVNVLYSHGLASAYTNAGRAFRGNLMIYYKENATFPEEIGEILNVQGGEKIDEILAEPIEAYIAYYANQDGLPIYRSSQILALMTRPETADSFYCFLLDRKGRIETHGISEKYLKKIGHPVPEGLKVYYHSQEHIKAVKKYHQELSSWNGAHNDTPNSISDQRSSPVQRDQQSYLQQGNIADSPPNKEDEPMVFPLWWLGAVGLMTHKRRSRREG